MKKIHPNMETQITYIVADNQDITRAGLHAYIAALNPSGSAVEAGCKKELLAALMACGEGRTVVVLDYTLFDFADVEELLVISNRFPSVCWILFSHELSEGLIRRLVAESRVGMVLKESPGEEIRSALQCAAKGERFLCHQIANWLLVAPAREKVHPLLTPTEVDILKLIARGKTVKEIAAVRVSSVHTIMTHKKNLFRKLGVNNVYEATKYALRAGLVEMVEYYI